MERVKLAALVQSGLREAVEQAARNYGADLMIAGNGPYQIVVEIAPDDVAAFKASLDAAACGAIRWSP
jgi:uncharacterized protein with GYD domain